MKGHSRVFRLSQEAGEASGKVSYLLQKCQEEWLRAYADLPHEGIGLCVSNAFLEEYQEKQQWVEAEAWNDEELTHNVHSMLGAVFLRVVELAEDAKDVGEDLKKKQMVFDSEKFFELSERLQVALKQLARLAVRVER